MKKISKFIMSLVILVASFTGCQKNNTSSNISNNTSSNTNSNNGNNTPSNGTDVAKILLANERLDGDEFNTNGDLFTDGKKAFNRIKEETRKYSNKLKNDRIKKKFEIDGNTYRWSEIDDYSNFLSFFDSYAENIENFANRGAELIDSTKKNVRTVDKWVGDESSSILLKVNKNEEMIFYRDNNAGFFEICRRYQNENGLNVFEIYIDSGFSKNRMTYIPGMRYEFTLEMDGEVFCLVAHNDKGYWDIMYTNIINFSNIYFHNMVMKDEAIYLTQYGIDQNGGEYFGDVQLVSFDGNADLFSFDNKRIEIFTPGIVGLDCFEIEASEDEVFDLSKNNHEYPENEDDYKVYSTGSGDDIQYFSFSDDIYAVFENGKKFKAGDALCDGKMTVSRISVQPIGGIDFYGSFILSLESEGEDTIDGKDIFYYLDQVSKEYGFSFKGDYDEIVAAARYAQKDAINFSKYYKWRGYNINDMDNIVLITQEEKDLFNEFNERYNEVKDNELININNQDELNNAYHFSDVEITSKTNLTNELNNLKGENITIKTDDTLLFVENENYTLEVAIAQKENDEYTNIYPLENNIKESKTFEGESSFEITESIDVTIPLLEEGDYVLVAYIATFDEGIRITKPIALQGEINEYVYSLNGLENKIYSSSNEVHINSKKDDIVNIILTGSYTYETLYNELETYAYENGELVDGNIEKYDGNSWVVVLETDTIEKGQYRIKYIKDEVEAYVIASIE